MLVTGPESMLGTSAMARITTVGRWSVFGEVIETFSSAKRETHAREETKPACSSDVTTTCETCDSSAESCGDKEKSGEACNISGNISRQDQNMRELKKEEKEMMQELKPRSSIANWGFIDKALVCGVFVSSLTILVLFISIASRVLLRQ